jgi:hypothetical protein
LHVIDITFAIYIKNIGAVSLADKRGGASHCLKGSNWGVNAAGDMLFGAGEKAF